MDYTTVTLLLVAAAVLLVLLVRGARSGPRLRVLERFAREAGLPLVPEAESSLRHYLGRHSRGVQSGALAAVLGCAAWTVTTPTWTWAGFTLVGTIAIAAILGGAVAKATSPADPPAGTAGSAGSAGAAHRTVLTRRDYLGRLDRWSAGVAVTVATVLLAGCAGSLSAAMNTAPAAVFALPLVLLLAAIVTAGLAHVVAGSLLRRWSRTPPASDAHPADPAGMAPNATELAWRDALRADTLRSILHAPVYLALASLVATNTIAANLTLDSPVGTLFVVNTFLFLMGVLAWQAVSNRPRTRTVYLRRFWPEAAADYDAARLRGATR